MLGRLDAADAAIKVVHETPIQSSPEQLDWQHWLHRHPASRATKLRRHSAISNNLQAAPECRLTSETPAASRMDRRACSRWAAQFGNASTAIALTITRSSPLKWRYHHVGILSSIAERADTEGPSDFWPELDLSWIRCCCSTSQFSGTSLFTGAAASYTSNFHQLAQRHESDFT